MNATLKWKHKTPRTPASASLLLVILLAGCAGIPDPPVDNCTVLFGDLRRTTEAYRDAQFQHVPGFAGLRSDRTLAALGTTARAPEQKRQWLTYLSERDAQASRIETSQLPAEQRDTWQADGRQALLAHCRHRQVERLANDPKAFERAVRAAQVPDDYSGWARALGLYPLAKPLFATGIATWQEAAARATPPPDNARWLGYAPLRLEASGPIALQHDSLGLPHADETQLKALFARHAPRLKIEQHSRNDRIGNPYFTREGTRAFSQRQPQVYQQLGWSQVNGRWHLQLVYQLWFERRPKPHALDLYGGELDGLLWRVTLDRQGNAVLYDSIHPCGCWHVFYLPADSELRFKQPPGDERRTAHRLDFTGDKPATLWLSGGEHRLLAVDNRPSRYPALRYQRGALDALRQMPHPQGHRSLYDGDGLVPGSERLERWLLWPSGVRSPGAMRQWGRHATAFIGRAQFDDPSLIDRYFDAP